MIHIKFKNLEKSELVTAAVEDRVKVLTDKFPDLNEGEIHVTLEMENSPTQAGPDQFKVKLYILEGRYKGIAVEKEDSNLYIALADMAEHMLERLNRFGDKVRVKERRKARKLSEEIKNNRGLIEPLI
jgi:ribosome-associated translation inhibitor RaiA